MSTEKSRATDKQDMTSPHYASIECDTRKLEPEVVRMLIGLVVATGVIGVLILLS